MPRTNFGSELGQINSRAFDSRWSVTQSFSLPKTYRQRAELLKSETALQRRTVAIDEQGLKARIYTTYYELLYLLEHKTFIGKYLAPTDVMFQLVNTDDIHANLTVFEKDIPKLKIGQKLTVTVPILPNKYYTAEIILIGRDLNESRAVEVHYHFNNYDHKLSPGMFLSADIQITETNALTVPNDAVVRFGNEQFIFIEKEKGVFEMQEVELGVMDKMYSQIHPLSISNISKQNMVTQGVYAILSKMKNTAEE